ncbi:MAG TPA: hypothetical protein VGC07_03615 [Granulicella sp.]
MKRSRHVHAPLLASAALTLLTACRQPEMQRCVDENNVVVNDSFCKDDPTQIETPDGHTGFIFMPHVYRYYYGGYGGFGLGTHVGGGSFSPSTGHSYSTGTVRGGFGSTFGRASS